MVMVRKIFNASNILGSAAFFSMIAAVGAVCGAVEGDCSCVTVMFFLAVFAGCTYLSIREDGQIK